MAKGPVETANPQQYLRLLLMRLLETQKALQPFIQRPEMAAVRRQCQENAYILSEIRSWLEAQEETSPLGPSLSSAQSAAKSGPGWSSPPPTPEPSPTSGKPLERSAFATFGAPVPAGTSQVQSSLPSGLTLPEGAKIMSGAICFRPPSSAGRLPSTSTGGPTPPCADKTTGDK
jgi:hypothetical protein